MVLEDAGALWRLLTEVAQSVVFIRRSPSANSMVDIVLLLGRRASSVDSEFVRSVIDSGTTVVSAQVPSFSPEGGMIREEWSGAHHQHGVDLARAGSDLRLRDVVLVTMPEPLEKAAADQSKLREWAARAKERAESESSASWSSCPRRRSVLSEERGWGQRDRHSQLWN